MQLFELIKNILFFWLRIENNFSFPKPLTKKEEKKALDAARNGDLQARNKLVEHNLRLVVHIIKKYYSDNNEHEDLISIGTIGLIKGINSFDPDKGTRLATYASRCIENEILMHFRAMKKTAQDISMSDPIDTDSEGNPLTLTDIICTEDTIVDDIGDNQNCAKVRQLVAGIKNERDKKIIILRYGMSGKEPMTQQEVADIMGISRSYVSRIETKVLKSMRKEFDGYE